MVHAVLVGCGAMSKAWLEAARQTDGVTITGLVDLDERARRGARGRVRARRRRDRHRPRRGSASTRGRHGFRRRRPGGQARRRAHRVPPWLPPAHREAARRHAASMPLAIIEAARRAGRIHAVVQNRRYVAEVRRIRRFLDSGAIGAPTSMHCRLLRRPAFRRLPRGDAPRPAARHGDPYLRRRALHGERRAARASTATNGSRRTPGAGRDRRRSRCSRWPTASSSPIAAAGAPTACAQAGRAAGGSSASAAR